MYIERLSGTFAATLPTGIILDVQGIGYGVELPLSTLVQLPRVGSKINLWISTYVREDSLRLFGFRTYEDRQTFEVLLSLGGVGPKVALAILSTLTLSAIERAVAKNDTKILESVPGVGARMAEKIIVELRPKVARLQVAKQLDLQEDFVRLDAAGFDPLLPHADNETKPSGREALFEDLNSALENLGYKDKIIQPLLLKLRKHSEFKDLQDLMRQALKELTQGSIEVERHGKAEKKKAEALPVVPPKIPKTLGFSDDSVF
ncbi:MAG: Holliday junction branch migration protein RuvA [Chitinophagaceae bacterium]|nr:Holliday junction branch migration protein RuvA [Oligoflexus sp.]